MGRSHVSASIFVTLALCFIVVPVEARNLYLCTKDPASDQQSGGWLEKEFVVAVADDRNWIQIFSRVLLTEDGPVEFRFPGKFEKGFFGGYTKRYNRFESTKGPVPGGIRAQASFANDFSRYNFQIQFGASDGYLPYQGHGTCSKYDGPEPEVSLQRLNARRMGQDNPSNERESSTGRSERYRLTAKDVTSNGTLTCEYVNEKGQSLTYKNVSSCAEFIEK